MNMTRKYCNIIDHFKTPPGHESGIVLARHADHYRLLHGQLRLVARLHAANEIAVDVKDEGMVRIVKGCGGLQVVRGNQRLPLLRDE